MSTSAAVRDLWPITTPRGKPSVKGCLATFCRLGSEEETFPSLVSWLNRSASRLFHCTVDTPGLLILEALCGVHDMLHTDAVT